MMEITKLSSKWQGILPRPPKPFAATKLSDVVGSTGYQGRRKTLRDMDNAVLREACKRR